MAASSSSNRPGASVRPPRVTSSSAGFRRGRGRRREAGEDQGESQRRELFEQAESRVGSTLLGKWQLDGLLGVGGMAAVFSATHRNGNRVAIKLLHPHVGLNGSLRDRFLREGYAANAVEHPGVVNVLDDDELEDGTPFLVMELLEGETLDARCKRNGGRLGVRESLAICDDLLAVLVAAHEKGIWHRDIKPENIFLCSNGVLKVLDFGIASVRVKAAAAPTATKTGAMLGTPAFMAPEQARGRVRDIDARSDLWAVGATLFTLLTGRHVHTGDTANEVLIMAATQPAQRLVELLPTAPPQVADIVDRALAFEKEARWTDARSMRDAVQTLRALPEATQWADEMARAPTMPDYPRSLLPPPLPRFEDETPTAVGPMPQFTEGRTAGAAALSLPPTGGTRVPRWVAAVVGAVACAAGALLTLNHLSAPSQPPASSHANAAPAPLPEPVATAQQTATAVSPDALPDAPPASSAQESDPRKNIKKTATRPAPAKPAAPAKR